MVIPPSLRQDIKSKVHDGQMGINSCIRRARDLVFWPGMAQDIRQFVESCAFCATYANKQQPETLRMSPIPDRPWQCVASDIFSVVGRVYLIIVDLYSGYFEVDYLTDMSSAIAVNKMKHHFARFGIPESVLTDCGSQYTSGTFSEICKGVGI